MTSQPHPTRRSLRAASRWRAPRLAIAVALICLIGVGVFLYPSAASWYMQYLQSSQIRGYSTEIEGIGAQERADALAAAERYNDALTGGGAEVAANERKPLADDASGTDAEYDALLDADGQGLIGRIQIPTIDADLPILHGTGDDVLDVAVGHLEGTALPVGGAGTHSVLTAHRGLATAELFSRLDEVQVGDTFTISVFGDVLTYRVRDTQVVLPEDTASLSPEAGQDLVTLVTCTPLGINSHRILVTGERVIPTPIVDRDAAATPPQIPRFPWWAVLLVAVAALLALYVWWAGRPRRPVVAASGPEVGVSSGSVVGGARAVSAPESPVGGSAAVSAPASPVGGSGHGVPVVGVPVLPVGESGRDVPVVGMPVLRVVGRWRAGVVPVDAAIRGGGRARTLATPGGPLSRDALGTLGPSHLDPEDAPVVAAWSHFYAPAAFGPAPAAPSSATPSAATQPLESASPRRGGTGSGVLSPR